MTPALALLALLSPLVVVDGDTLRLGAERIRIMGLDAPETHLAQCPAERAAGEAAAARLRALVDAARRVGIDRHGRDRYGRTLAVVTLDGIDVATTLIGEGHAREYHGERRRGWCE